MCASTKYVCECNIQTMFNTSLVNVVLSNNPTLSMQRHEQQHASDKQFIVKQISSKSDVNIIRAKSYERYLSWWNSGTQENTFKHYND